MKNIKLLFMSYMINKQHTHDAHIIKYIIWDRDELSQSVSPFTYRDIIKTCTKTLFWCYGYLCVWFNCIPYQRT